MLEVCWPPQLPLLAGSLARSGLSDACWPDSCLLSVQADALEHALIAALPLGPQSAAGGVSLPDSFSGELQVSTRAFMAAGWGAT